MMLVIVIIGIIYGMIKYRKQLAKFYKIIGPVAIIISLFVILQTLQTNAHVLHIPEILHIPKTIYDSIIISLTILGTISSLIYGYFTRIRYNSHLKRLFLTCLTIVAICIIALIILILKG